ncbi:MAG: CCA tRNA nucleotidyltransferase [Synergistaceae bacterium]|nr:CCA tRNA nucleotidyltransferase [Synergistaceae bacterium]
MHNYLDVLAKIEETGAKAWLVGDTVRMLLMGVQPEVITLAIDSDDMYSVAMALGTGDVDSRGIYPALRGELLGVNFRAFSLRGATIEDDLAQRDLSIEAIALRSDGGIVDPFGGRFDIRNKVIRLTGDNVDLINSDPLRILRMLRFAAEFEMDIFWKTASDVRSFLEEHADHMRDIPMERWGRELMKGLVRRPYRFMRMCDSFRIIPFFLNELEDMKKNHREIFDHTLKVLEVIEKRLDTNKIMQSDAFVLAGLFNNIGLDSIEAKDRTKYTDRLISDCMTRWNIASETIEEVIAIMHMYPKYYEPISEPRFCKGVLEHSEEAVEVALEFAKCVAEAQGKTEQYSDVFESNTWNLRQVLRRFANVRLQTEGAPRYMTGREIMNLLQLKPGKRVGELLDGLDFAVGTGIVNSRAKAEEWLKAQ